MNQVMSEEKEKMAQLMEKMLNESIKAESENLKTLKDLPKAKVEGVIAGAQEGLFALSRIKEGVPNEIIISTFNNKIRSSIYNLFEAEEKYKKRKDNIYKREIAYHDNLINVLQLLKSRLSVLIEEDSSK